MLCSIFSSWSRESPSGHHPRRAISYSIVETSISIHIGRSTADDHLLTRPCSEHEVSVSVIDRLYSRTSEPTSMADRLGAPSCLDIEFYFEFKLNMRVFLMG